MSVWLWRSSFISFIKACPWGFCCLFSSSLLLGPIVCGSWPWLPSCVSGSWSALLLLRLLYRLVAASACLNFHFLCLNLLICPGARFRKNLRVWGSRTRVRSWVHEPWRRLVHGDLRSLVNGTQIRSFTVATNGEKQPRSSLEMEDFTTTNAENAHISKNK